MEKRLVDGSIANVGIEMSRSVLFLAPYSHRHIAFDNDSAKIVRGKNILLLVCSSLNSKHLANATNFSAVHRFFTAKLSNTIYCHKSARN